MKPFDPDSDPGPVPSPCISMCQMNQATGYCEGCFRTIDEIVKWGGSSDDTKRQVWREIYRRQQELF